jgi:hypothetical protein
MNSAATFSSRTHARRGYPVEKLVLAAPLTEQPGCRAVAKILCSAALDTTTAGDAHPLPRAAA